MLSVMPVFVNAIFLLFTVKNLLEFYPRYAILTPETYPKWHGDVKSGIKHLMKAVNMDADQWQLGKTKVFIKNPESVCIFMFETKSSPNICTVSFVS